MLSISFSSSSSLSPTSSCSSSFTSTPRLLRTKRFSHNKTTEPELDLHEQHNHSMTDSPVNDRNHNVYLDICGSSSSSLSSTSTKTQPINILLAWRNLRYEIRRTKFLPLCSPSKVILKRLNGFIEYHSLTGFMGPSGAGKTTLLNCLNGNFCSGLTKNTEIYLNKFERKTSMKIGFIEQHVHETIIGRMNVGEILRYAFLFKNGLKFHGRIDAHIDSVIKELLLEHSILNNRFDDCSGGEQKRIAVAQELMSLVPPSLLFMDEPTTGLDSNAALLVMKCLRKLASRYRMSVTVSIHTPSAEIVDLFDKLYILSKGGVCIYSGPPRLLKENLQQKLNIETWDDERPAIEQYLKIACNTLESDQVRKLADETLKTEHEKLLPHIPKMDFLHWGPPRHLKRFTFQDFLLQFHRLTKVVFITDWRIFMAQILIYFLSYIGLVLVFDPKMVRPSGCYSLMDYNNGTSQTCAEQIEDDNLMETYVNYQSFCVMITGFSMVGLGSLVFAPLLKVFRNEHRNRWYSLGTFYWAYLLVRFLEMTIFTIMITVLSYFPPGNHHIDMLKSTSDVSSFVSFLSAVNWNRFGHFLGIFWLYNIYMQSIGQLIAVTFLGDAELSLIVSYVSYLVLCLLNGYLITLEHMNNPLLVKFAKIIASNVVSKGLIWSFYGLDRCDQDGYYSVMLYKYYINPDTVYGDLGKIIINSFILRILTITILMLRCNLNRRFLPMVQSRSNREPEPIDYPELKNISTCRTSTPPAPRRVKQNSEIAFEEFSRNKIIVAWRNLTLFGSSSVHEIRSAKRRPKDRKILNNLNGQFCFGTMNVLMGTSGSGKTSLLKVLNGQLKTRLSDETQIFLSRFTPTRICYLTQDVSGHLLPGLTARQSLIYASRLKNREYSYGMDLDHEQVALNLLEELDLAETTNTLVQNCSGGERKRLALALELTSMLMPNLICIDEPTSGLDSNSAEIVMACLREFVHKHHITIIASIHQPNTDLMNMFDQIYVLARGGVCIYSGPPTQIRTNLAQIPEVVHSLFPIEELIKYSCRNNDEPFIKDLVHKNDQKIVEKNPNVEQETQYVSDGIPLNRIRFNLASLAIVCRRYSGYINGYLWYHWAMYLAIYAFYACILRWFFDPRIALTDGCVSLEEDFNQACNRTEDSIEKETNLINNVRYNFFAFNVAILLVMLQSGQSFIKEFKFFCNEHRNGWYSSGIFYLTKYLYESIIMILLVAFYVRFINIYEPIHPGIYWWLFLLLNLGVQASQGLSHFLCLLVNGNSFISIALVNVAFMMMLMTANFFCKISSLHYVLQMLSHLSICRFMNEGNMLLQYGFGRCGPKHIQVILFNLEIDGDHHFNYCVIMLIMQIFLYRLMALAALVIKSNPLDNRRRRAENIINYQKQLKPSNAIIPGLSSHLEFRVKKVHF